MDPSKREAFEEALKGRKLPILTLDNKWYKMFQNLQDYPEIAYEMDFDACICEATHFKPEVAVDFFKKSRFKKLIFNHVSENWNIRVGNAWSVENGEKNLLEYYKDVPYPIYIAHDGDEFLF